jgi:hypothetical protein
MRYGSMKNGQSAPFHVPLPSEPPLDDAYREKCVGEQQFHDKSGCWESLSWNSVTGRDMGACCMDSVDLGLSWFARPQSSNKSCGERSPHFCGGKLDVGELHTDVELDASGRQVDGQDGDAADESKQTGVVEGEARGGTRGGTRGTRSGDARQELVKRQGYDSTGFVPPADPYWEKADTGREGGGGAGGGGDVRSVSRSASRRAEAAEAAVAAVAAQAAEAAEAAATAGATAGATARGGGGAEGIEEASASGLSEYTQGLVSSLVGEVQPFWVSMFFCFKVRARVN